MVSGAPRNWNSSCPRLIEAFGDLPAENITKQDVTRWLVDREKKRDWKPATRNRWQAAFSLVFRVGLDNEKIERNPAARIKRKTEKNEKVRFLSPDEEARLRVAIVTGSRHPSLYLAALDIALHTGMRMSEEFSLTWSQVDLERRMIHLPTTKSGKPHHVTLNAVALAAFETLKKTASGPYVFPTRDGVNVKTTRAWFDPAVERAEIKGVTWHTLRHTFASRL